MAQGDGNAVVGTVVPVVPERTTFSLTAPAVPHCPECCVFKLRHVSLVPQLVATGDDIGVEPFEALGLEVQVSKGLASRKHKNHLYATKVVLGNDRFKAGDVVYIKNDHTRPEAQRIEYDIDGAKFVLVSTKLIVAVKELGPR